MDEHLHALVDTEGFHPHGFCYLWKPELIALHVVADVLIGLAYVAIGFQLARFVRRSRGELPFSKMFVAFGVFIAACGATHFVEVWTLWTPAYWFSGWVKVVTAAASVLTAVALPRLVPLALATLASARSAERHRTELEIAHRRLTELDELKTQFFANVSHELRTPLTLILAPVEERLADPALDPASRATLEGVHRNARLLLRHVNNLLDVAKLQAGRMELSWRRVDLATEVRQAAAHFESHAGAHGQAFEVRTPASLPGEADPDQLERIVFNLLGNAVKFTPDGGRVRVTLEAVGTHAELAVEDSGPGVPEAQRETIFEPFRQADGTAARRHEGTGLGLAIVHDLAHLHGGTVAVDASPSLGGARFVVRLPLAAPAGTVLADAPAPAPADAPDPAAEAAAAVSAEPEPAPGAPPAPDPAPSAAPDGDADGPDDRALVLVVEDNPELRHFIARTLESEWRVVRAEDGAEGIELARRLRPDLILSDVMMPGVTGDVLVREIRRDPALADVPVVLLSARVDEEMRLGLLRGGAQDYLTKPFSPEELRARVRNWVRTKRASDILRAELDTTAQDLEGLAEEVTARKRELETALEAARLAFEEAEAASRARSDFLSVMSHELRTPLNAILGYIDLLAAGIAGPMTDGQREYAGRVEASARHLLSLVDEVLTFARMEAGREAVAEETADLRDVVRDAASFVEPTAQRKGLALAVALPEAPVLLRTDAGKARQIVLNLLSNAVKFTAAGEVRVTLRPRGGGAEIVVRDTGPGIAPEHRERIFEPFWQADASKTRTAGGTGLGLTISRRLVELLGGDIAVESDGETGSTFTVTLPARSGEG